MVHKILVSFQQLMTSSFACEARLSESETGVEEWTNHNAFHHACIVRTVISIARLPLLQYPQSI